MFNAYFDAMRNYADSLFGTTIPNGGLFLGLVFLTHLLPQLAALAGRLHDVGWSGWRLLIFLTGVAGLFLLALACLPGSKNQIAMAQRPRFPAHARTRTRSSARPRALVARRQRRP